jgi:dissimilatory sulfite reductase (desulfoviridin) alpha/beta subunit
MADRFIEDQKTKFEVKIKERPEVLNLADLKSGGFIKQRQKDLFTVRLKVPGGRLDLNKMERIVGVARKYSSAGYVHLSFRQSVEIPYVNYKDFDTLIKDLAEFDQPIASCGPRVRATTACSGCEYNPNGLIDTQKFAIEMDKKFFGRQTPHKFKISFSGCPIDCARTREMDLGFQGIVEPVWEESSCIGCTLCAKACKEWAIIARESDGKPVYDPSKCIYCGDCIRACPTSSWTAKRVGHLVRVGGKHGRHPREANEVAKFVTDEEVPVVIEKTIEWYNQNGKRGERLGSAIDRVGLEHYREFMRDIFRNE